MKNPIPRLYLAVCAMCLIAAIILATPGLH